MIIVLHWLLSPSSRISLSLLLSGEEGNRKHSEKSMCRGVLKCQRATTVSLTIILSFDNAVNEPWYFVITVLFVKIHFSPLVSFYISVVGSLLFVFLSNGNSRTTGRK